MEGLATILNVEAKFLRRSIIFHLTSFRVKKKPSLILLLRMYNIYEKKKKFKRESKEVKILKDVGTYIENVDRFDDRKD